MKIKAYLDNEEWSDEKYENAEPIEFEITKDDLLEIASKKHKLDPGTFINEFEIN